MCVLMPSAKIERHRCFLDDFHPSRAPSFAAVDSSLLLDLSAHFSRWNDINLVYFEQCECEAVLLMHLNVGKKQGGERDNVKSMKRQNKYKSTLLWGRGKRALKNKQMMENKFTYNTVRHWVYENGHNRFESFSDSCEPFSWPPHTLYMKMKENSLCNYKIGALRSGK